MAIEALSEGNLDCHSCDDTLKKERGCSEKGIVPYTINNEVVYRCPLTFIEEITWQYLKAYNFYEKSLLPNGISWLNESNKYLQAMMIIGNEYKRNKVK